MEEADGPAALIHWSACAPALICAALVVLILAVACRYAYNYWMSPRANHRHSHKSHKPSQPNNSSSKSHKPSQGRHHLKKDENEDEETPSPPPPKRKRTPRKRVKKEKDT